MCGIAGCQGRREGDVNAALDLIAYRGPDGRGVVERDGWTVGHVRLAIIDVDPRADQPMTRGQTDVAYNGECWNHKTLRAELEAAGCVFSTECDTETVAWALDTWGESALDRMEGMFAVAWVNERGTMRLARDRFGEVPFHYGRRRGDGGLVFASELRAVLALGADPRTVRWVEPGSVVVWPVEDAPTVRCYRPTVAHPDPDATLDYAAEQIYARLAVACEERSMTDVPAACLLSGGIDSSAVALLLAPHLPDMRFYTCVHDPKSLDLRCARMVAEQLDRELIEVQTPAPTADDLSRVINVIEAPFKAQVEIAWGCLWLADALHADGVKVVFTGEGSDELWASYNSAYHNIRRHREGWYGYRRDTFINQHRKNFPRCNKIFARRSIEARLPFLHSDVVDWGLTLPREAIYMHCVGGEHKLMKEKGHMRVAFNGLLPDRVVNRDKQAFQDAAGLKKAAAAAVAAPERFYRAEFARQFQGVKL